MISVGSMVDESVVQFGGLSPGLRLAIGDARRPDEVGGGHSVCYQQHEAGLSPRNGILSGHFSYHIHRLRYLPNLLPLMPVFGSKIFFGKGRDLAGLVLTRAVCRYLEDRVLV